jgi:ABC-type sugar transport system permease subunit
MTRFLSRPNSPERKEKHPNAALRRREAKIGLLLLSPWILGFIILKLVPILWALGYSFTNFNLLTPDATTFAGLQNYLKFLIDIDAWTSLVGSLGYFVTTVPLELLVALGLAAILSSERVRAKGFWRPVIFMPSIIPAAAISFIWLGFISPTSGWLNRLIMLPLGLPQITQRTAAGNLPFLATIMALWSIGPGFLIMYGAMQSIPRDVYEAAHIDGAGPLNRFLGITLPIISPAIFFSLVINLTSAFGGSMLLDRGFGYSQGLSPMENYIKVVLFTKFDLGYAAALAWIMFAVTMTITIVLFRSAQRWVYFPEEDGHETIL